ncbi:hypothetical protein [Marinobacter sp. C2H3]|uniref:hypothetical protein n=1 Tax=Marinobacter sp. C2H3 TaxID=3119003 RepID=UPI00300EC66E
MSESRTLQPPRGPACEGPVLIIEVVGQDHPEGHRFRLFDPADQTEQEWMDQRGHREALSQSELAVWPTTPEARQNVWLDIDADDGSPIRVLLFEHVGATPRQPIAQWNRVCPLVPITSLMAQDPDPGGHPSHPVPVRAGYVYVFRDGRLWRELQVDAPADQPPGFRDVRLSDYRQQGGDGLTEDRRPAVGRRLDAIWVPLREMDSALTGQIQMAFSEVQWPGDRVAFLETDAAARRDRCQSLSGDGLVWQGRPLSEGAPGPGVIQPVATLPPARAREPFLEQHLPDPWRNVLDLTGNYAHGLYQKACDEQKAFDEASDAAHDAWEAAGYRDCPLRWAPAARLQAFAGRANQPKKKPQPEAKPISRVVDVSADKALWEPLGAAPDAWADARTRGYASVTLNDDLFEVRHSLNQTLSAQRYLTAVLEAVNEEPYGDSAQLIERVMGPEYLGGKKNPLNDYLKNINNTYFGALQRTLKSAERRLATESLGLTQAALTHLVHQPRYQNAFADLFALKGLDYAEGFALFGDLVSVLRLDPNTVDPLNKQPMVSREQVRAANSVIFDILDPEKQKPLSAMVFPRLDGTGGNAVAETESSSAEPVGGDGSCRPNDLRCLPDEAPQPDTVQTLTAASLLAVAKGNSLNGITEAKRFGNAVSAILDALEQKLVVSLKAAKPWLTAAPARLYGPLLSLANARNPKLFGDVKMVPRNAISKDMVMLGVHDPEGGLKYGLTEADRTYLHSKRNLRRFYGEIRTSDGELLASTRRSEISDLGKLPEARNVVVFVAEKDSDIAKYLRNVRLGRTAQSISKNVQVPFFVFGLELLNVCQEIHLIKKTSKQRGEVRASLGLTSALSEVGMAIALLADQISKNMLGWQGISKFLDKAVVTVPKSFETWAEGGIARALPETVTRRMVGGMAIAYVAIMLSLWDMQHEFDTADYDAAFAHGVFAIGTGMTVMGSLMSSTATESGAAIVLLEMGPVAWAVVGVVMAVIAGIAAIFLDDPPLVDWLKRGPFGDEQDDLYDYLQNNPSELYYRLLGLLLQPRIRIENVRDLAASLSSKGYQISPKKASVIDRVSKRVVVESDLALIFDDIQLTTSFRGTRVSEKVLAKAILSSKQRLWPDPEPLFTQLTPSGAVYYFDQLETAVSTPAFGATRVSFIDLQVRAQWRLQASEAPGGEARAFPSPPLYDDVKFLPDSHEKPDFTKTDRPFWADEQTYRF